MSSEQPAWLRWFTPQARRMILWMSVAALGTYAMGSAVNGIFAKDIQDQSTQTNIVGASARVGGGSGFGGWWDPHSVAAETSTEDSGMTVNGGSRSPSSSGGHSIIPVDHNAGFSTDSLMVNDLVPIGSSSRATYDVLGLGTRSFTPAGVSGGSLTVNSIGSAEVHFSLHGDLSLVPPDNLAASALSVTTLAAVPEPSTAGLLLAALAGLAFRRRRPPATTA